MSTVTFRTYSALRVWRRVTFATLNLEAAMGSDMKCKSEVLACCAGNFNTGLPAEWTTSFDLVWSQEAFCHAKSQVNLLKEIKRVLKPGGSAVFTDIMRMVRL